jgi:transposase
MDKEDVRKHTLEQLHERRKQVVRLHNKGHKVMKIVERTGLTYPTVRSAIDLFTQGGWPAIRPTPRGRTKGEGRLLTIEQENRIQRAIIDKRPEQLKMDICLWSRAAAMQLIAQEYGIKLPVMNLTSKDLQASMLAFQV